MEETYCINEIRKNLLDAGCTDELIEQFVVSFQQNNHCTQKKLLKEHKKNLNEDIYRRQKQIDCLDYLSYKLKL